MSNESLITRDSSLTSYVNSLPASFTVGNASDLVATKLGKPEVAIRPGCNPNGVAFGRWERKLGDRAAGADAPDFVNIFRKPEVAIGSGCDTLYLVAITGCGKLGDRPVGRDTPDIGVAKLGKPEIAIGSDCDKLRETQ